MPDLNPDPLEPSTAVAVPCRHLRSKGMYVYTDMAEPHEESGTTMYWCLKTMTAFGPDDEAVDGHDCRSPGRSCHEPV